MKVYAFYNESYAPLYTIFKSSLLALEDGFELHAHQTNQTFEHLDPGYEGQHGKYKINFIINAIKENVGESILFSDVDIKFFNPFRQTLLKVLEEYDVAFQSQYSPLGHRRPGGPPLPLNAGFIATRCNQKTLDFFEKVLQANDGHTIIEKAVFVNLHLIKQHLLDYQFASLSNKGAIGHGDDVYLLHANVHDTTPGFIKKMNKALLKTKEKLRKYPKLAERKKKREIELQGNKKTIEAFVKNDCLTHKGKKSGIDCKEFWQNYQKALNQPGCRGCFEKRVIKKYSDIARQYLLKD